MTALDINTIGSSLIAAIQKSYNIVTDADPFGRKGEELVNDMASSAKGLDFLKFSAETGVAFDAAEFDTGLKAFEVIMSLTGEVQEKIINSEPKAFELAGPEIHVQLTDFVTKNLTALYSKPTTATSLGDTMTATTSTSASVAPIDKTVIESAFAMGINSLLTAGTKGKFTDINEVLEILANSTADAANLKAEVIKLATAASRPVVPKTGTDATVASMGPLTYEVVNIAANEIFKDSAGNKPKNLTIEIPTLVWKNAAGDVVQHPECPVIDNNYLFNLPQVFQYLIALTSGMNTWAFGHTGTGKSTFIEQVAARIGWPVSRINLDSNLERADLVGHTTLKQDAGATVTQFEEGLLPRAMQRPGIFLMDEIDAGRPDILFVVQRALENKGLMLTEDGGRLVQPHPLFRFAATANTRGQGDEYGMYAGTRAMNASLIDRFTAFIEFDYMTPENESKLMQSLTPGLDPARANQIAQYAKEVRVAFTKGDVGNTISPRGLSVMAHCFTTFKGHGMKDDVALTLAMEMTILNKVPSDSKQKFTEISTRVFK